MDHDASLDGRKFVKSATVSSSEESSWKLKIDKLWTEKSSPEFEMVPPSMRDTDEDERRPESIKKAPSVSGPPPPEKSGKKASVRNEVPVVKASTTVSTPAFSSSNTESNIQRNMMVRHPCLLFWPIQRIDKQKLAREQISFQMLRAMPPECLSSHCRSTLLYLAEVTSLVGILFLRRSALVALLLSTKREYHPKLHND